jgi:parvulin-like peptidyl-prolyl isomerase
LNGGTLDRALPVARLRASLMKSFRCIPVFATLLGLLAPALSSRASELADGIQAVVNDQAITFAQVEEYTAPAAQVLRSQYADQPNVYDQKIKSALDDSLEQLIERQLILHSFDAEGYSLPDGAVDDLVQERIRERFGNRITLMKTLQSQGQTYEEFRKDVRDQYIISALRSKNVAQGIIISPFKVENYYLAHQDDFKLEDQVKLRMIVLKKSSPDDTNTLSLANEISSQIKGGATFQEMAAVYSQGSQQHQGGDWGWVERSVLRKDLADVAFSLKPGQVSAPLDTSDYVYLMQVEQARPAHVRPLGEIRSDIEQTLRTQEQARLEKQWIETLKRKTFIRYF